MGIYTIGDYRNDLEAMNYSDRIIYHWLGYAKEDRILASLGIDIEEEALLISQKKSRLSRSRRSMVIRKFNEISNRGIKHG